MTLRTEFSLIHSEFNAFLFAPIFEEKNGMLLTVLSGLTRLGYDPWQEAARLTDLPRPVAVQALAATIVRLPEARDALSEARTIATRLANLLPQRRVIPRSGGEAGNRKKMKFRTGVWLAGLVFAVTLLFGIAHLRTDPDPRMRSSGDSSMQR